MIFYEGSQTILQKHPHSGGYSHISVPAHIVQSLVDGRKTRVLCIINNQHQHQCGLNPSGDGHYSIIINARTLKKMSLQNGQTIHFTLQIDPDPLGVPMPEALAELLLQDDASNAVFQTLTPGRKRTIIRNLSRYKNIDKFISTALSLIHQPPAKRNNKES